MSETDLPAASTHSTVPLSVGRSSRCINILVGMKRPPWIRCPLAATERPWLQIRQGAGAGIFKPITLDKLVRAGRHRLAVSIRFHVLAEGGGSLRILPRIKVRRLRPGMSMGGHCR